MTNNSLGILGLFLSLGTSIIGLYILLFWAKNISLCTDAKYFAKIEIQITITEFGSND